MILNFENISFSYRKGQAILKDFSMTVSEGDTIALQGPSGII